MAQELLVGDLELELGDLALADLEHHRVERGAEQVVETLLQALDRRGLAGAALEDRGDEGVHGHRLGPKRREDVDHDGGRLELGGG
ncbi:hypothetical protein D3C87_1903650 [compost metagenome]